MIEGLLGGLSGLFTLHNMLLLVLGCGLGTFIGMLSLIHI